MLAPLRAIIRRSVRALLSVGTRLPSRDHIVAYGWPDTEGNSLHAAAQLASSLDARVYLLCEDRTLAARQLAQLSTNSPAAFRVKLVRKRSLRAVALVASARVVLFTHGLFGNPRPGNKRLFVNLWHGHGPKRTANNAYEARIPSDVLVTNTYVWGRETARSLGLPESTVANIGNPRQDEMLTPTAGASLTRLGLSETRPFVLWMPTFRQVSNRQSRQWRDSEPLSSNAAVNESLDALRTAMEMSGVDFRVKLHPMDADRLRAFREWQITDADLLDVRTTLYSFIGASAGLISDYSSVWVEYLSLDRPLLLFCPDADRYDHGRGFKHPSMFEIAADLIAEDARQVSAFLEAVKGDRDWQRTARRRTAKSLQLCDPGLCSPRLLTALADAATRKGLSVKGLRNAAREAS